MYVEKYYMLKAIQWELYWGVPSTEHQKWVQVSYFCLTHVQLSQLRSNSEQTHLSLKLLEVSGISSIWFLLLVTTEGRSMGKHSQAFYKESQGIKLFLDLIFKNACWKSFLSLLSIRMNLAIRSLYK